MNDREVDDFLKTQTTAMVIAGYGRQAPQGAVGRLEYEGSGRVGFSLRADDLVVALLATDGAVCCMAEQFPSYYEIKAVVLHGHARRTETSESGVATFAVEVEKVLSFDFAKLLGRT